jgi:hypothetical protein
VAIALNAFVNLPAATVTALKAKYQAEMERQLLAGQNFGQSGRSRGGITHEALVDALAALAYAESYQSGTLVTDTIADLSNDPV